LHWRLGNDLDIGEGRLRCDPRCGCHCGHAGDAGRATLPLLPVQAVPVAAAMPSEATLPIAPSFEPDLRSSS
jgi:hypothetical protein